MIASLRNRTVGPLTAVVAALALLTVSETTAAAYPTDAVEIRGRGWGHGRGMGQYGALGYALDHGWSYQQILDHFYGGTTTGTQPDAPISVRLASRDGQALIVRSDHAFRVGGVAVPAGGATYVERLSDGRWRVHTGPGCAGPWTVVHDGMAPGTVHELVTTYQGDALGSMLNICEPSGTRPYRGSLVIRTDAGVARTGNVVAMERYLRGVVPRESPASWADLGDGRGMEQLKAQAVAARSYAWAENRGTFKTCDTISCQVYGGAAGEDPRSTAAVDATTGQVRRLDGTGAIARTEFSSSTGGWTAGGTFPAVQDLGDAVSRNPNHTWRDTRAATDVASRFDVGELLDVVVTRRNGLGADGGRVLEVEVRGTGGTRTVTGLQFRSTLDLKSDWFTVAPDLPFDDVADSPHLSAILAIAEAGITEGCVPDRYCPSDTVSRGQMAGFLDRAVQPGPTTVDAFDDDEHQVHEASINRLAAAEIVSGVAPRRFDPGPPVTREQMATFLARAFDLSATGPPPFTDVAPRGVHAAAVAAIAEAGITSGCAPERFCPGATVTRAQMATFLAEALDLR